MDAGVYGVPSWQEEWASQELIALTKHVQDTYLAVIVAPHCFYSHRAQNV